MFRVFNSIKNYFQKPNKYHRNDQVDKTIEAFDFLCQSSLMLPQTKDVFAVTMNLLKILPEEFKEKDQIWYDKILAGSILLAIHKQSEKNLKEKVVSFVNTMFSTKTNSYTRPLASQQTLDDISKLINGTLNNETLEGQIIKIGDAALIKKTIHFDGKIPSKFHTLSFLKPDYFNHYLSDDLQKKPTTR